MVEIYNNFTELDKSDRQCQGLGWCMLMYAQQWSGQKSMDIFQHKCSYESKNVETAQHRKPSYTFLFQFWRSRFCSHWDICRQVYAIYIHNWIFWFWFLWILMKPPINLNLRATILDLHTLNPEPWMCLMCYRCRTLSSICARNQWGFP